MELNLHVLSVDHTQSTLGLSQKVSASTMCTERLESGVDPVVTLVSS